MDNYLASRTAKKNRSVQVAIMGSSLVVFSFANYFATPADKDQARFYLSNAVKGKYVATFSHILQTKFPFPP